MKYGKRGREGASSIAKDLIDREDPEHELFCRDLRPLSGVIFLSFDDSSTNKFATAQSLEQIEKYFLVKQVCYICHIDYHLNCLGIDRTG